MIKSRKIFALTLLASLIVLAVLSARVINVEAQTQATVIVGSSIGGTTDPTGTTTYPDGTQVTFTATPDNDFVFVNWIFSTSAGSSVVNDQTTTIPVQGGTTYNVQAVFSPLLTGPNVSVLPSNLATAAIVVVLSSAGGTTDPAPGTYALADATSLMLTAIPASGFDFSHWVIAGTPMDHGAYSFTATPTDNPYNVNHGYGNTYSYQPVFTPTGTTEPTPTVPEFSGLTTILLAVVLASIAFGTYAYRRKTK
jgi:Divergent InlB B-repeat domain